MTQELLTQSDAFLEGKLAALRILIAHYEKQRDSGLKYLTTETVIQTLDTLVLNLEEVFKNEC